MDGFKPFVILMLIAIVLSLGKAMFHMSSGGEQTAGTVQALTVRIGLSVALFLFLILGWAFGLVTPHALGG